MLIYLTKQSDTFIILTYIHVAYGMVLSIKTTLKCEICIGTYRKPFILRKINI